MSAVGFSSGKVQVQEQFKRESSLPRQKEHVIAVNFSAINSTSLPLTDRASVVSPGEQLYKFVVISGAVIGVLVIIALIAMHTLAKTVVHNAAQGGFGS